MESDFETEMWVRGALAANMRLMKTVDGLDKSIEKLVFGYGTDTQTSMESILDIIERKKRLISLRVITAEVLSNLSPRRRETLIQRYIFERNCADAAREAGVNLRQFFRLHDAALRECVFLLKGRGCGAEWFERHYGDEELFISPGVRRRGQYRAEFRAVCAGA